MTSPCRPKPKLRWYIANDNQPDESATLLAESEPTDSQNDAIRDYNIQFEIPLNRKMNGRFLFCGADNSNRDFVLSKKILMNVTYPLDTPPQIEGFRNGSEIKVIKDSFVNLRCLVAGGNPLPTLEWNKNNDMPQIVSGSTVTRNIKWQAVDTRKDDLTCQAFQFALKYTAYVSVNVLYPPGTPTIMINTSSGVYVELNNVLNVIEGRPFTLKCYADSNPPVSSFQWNNLMPIASDIYNVANADRRNKDNIVCSVSNKMDPSDLSTFVNGYNSSFLQVNVLYPPAINIVRDATIIEGDNLDNLCNVTPGNPPDTNITWSWKGLTWNLLPKQPYNVSRNQSGVYRCSVRNLMDSSDGTRVFGNASGEFNLSVQYKTSVLRFVINEQNDKITINENDAVNLTCEIEGLPLPTGKPRKSPFIAIVDTVPCPTLVDVTLSFTAMAYPVPPEFGYVWTRQGESPDVWVNITSDGNKTNIITRGLQSNLTIKHVSQFDYGMYRLFIFNDVGQYNHTFTVVPAVDGNDGNSATSSSVSVVAASVAGTVAGVVILVAVVIIMVYKKRKRLSYQKKECSIQCYNVSESKVAELSISTQVDNATAYEAFQSTGSDQQYDSLSQDDCKAKNDSDCNKSANNRSLNVYEGLRNRGFDQQYEQISPIASNIETGQHMVYENLQLTRNIETCQDAK